MYIALQKSKVIVKLMEFLRKKYCVFSVNLTKISNHRLHLFVLLHTVEFTKFLYHLKIISWNQLYSKLFTKEIIFTEIFQKVVIQKFRKMHSVFCGPFFLVFRVNQLF